MIRQDFLKFDSTNELHKELTNILLLATENSNFFYCYCVKVAEGRKCDLCDLCHFLFDDDNLMDGWSPKKFLQLNYDNRDKLNDFVDKIFPFFERMELNEKRSFDFFNREFEWVLKDYSTATYHSMTLTEIIENDKDLVKNNPELFDKDFLKKTN